ncbi:MAG: dimethyl sulfoxide reductase anchor subunit family protein [Bacillota bacterium]
MRSSEWPLVFFTIMMQMTVGFFIALSISYNFLIVKQESVIARDINGRLIFLVWPVLIAALLISFFHLGSPKNAIYVMGNISTSWLSREILMSLIFTAFVLLTGFIFFRGIFSLHLRLIFLMLCAAAGVGLIISMSKLYMLETVPAWNSIATPGSFFLTALISGSFTLLVLLQFILQRHGKDIFSTEQTAAAAKVIAVIIIVLIVIEIVSWLLHLKVLSSSAAGAGKESFSLIVNGNTLIFAVRIILSLLALIFLILTIYISGRTNADMRFMYISFFIMILSEISGRYLFYAMYSRVGL